jgi:hypothetical protein
LAGAETPDRRRLPAAEQLRLGQPGRDGQRGEPVHDGARRIVRLEDHGVLDARHGEESPRQVGQRRALACHLHHVRVGLAP